MLYPLISIGMFTFELLHFLANYQYLHLKPIKYQNRVLTIARQYAKRLIVAKIATQNFLTYAPQSDGDDKTCQPAQSRTDFTRLRKESGGCRDYAWRTSQRWCGSHQ